MTVKTRHEPRWWFVAYAAALGAVIAGASALGGVPVAGALLAVPVMTVFGVVMALTPFGRLRKSPDERYEAIDKEAALFSYYVLIVVLIGGWLFELSQGRSGDLWGVLCTVAGVSFLGALIVLSRRR